MSWVKTIWRSSGVIVPSNTSNRPASAATVRSMSHASTVLLDEADLLSAENTPRKLPMNMNAVVGELAEWQLLWWMYHCAFCNFERSLVCPLWLYCFAGLEPKMNIKNSNILDRLLRCFRPWLDWATHILGNDSSYATVRLYYCVQICKDFKQVRDSSHCTHCLKGSIWCYKIVRLSSAVIATRKHIISPEDVWRQICSTSNLDNIFDHAFKSEPMKSSLIALS